MPFKIMAFDGGGVRSVISAMLLADLDPKGQMVRGTDLFVGTSSGAIVALALVYGIRAEAIADFFAAHAADIYDEADKEWNSGNPFSFEQQVALDTVPTYDKAADGETIKSVFQAKYRSEKLRDALIGLFGNARLSELPRSGPQVAVTALQLGERGKGTWTPVSIGTGRKDPLSDMLLADAAMASMATPTLFAPHKPSPPMGERWGYFADGGVFASNPAMAGAEYAVQHCRANMQEIRLVSFGTAEHTAGIEAGQLGRAECWGAWQWMKPYTSQSSNIPAVPLIDATRSASGQMAERYAKMVLGDWYKRVDCELEAPVKSCDFGALPALKAMTAHYMQTATWIQQAEQVQDMWVRAAYTNNGPDMAKMNTPKTKFSRLFGL